MIKDCKDSPNVAVVQTRLPVVPKKGLKFIASGKAKNVYEVMAVRSKTVVLTRISDGVVLETQVNKFNDMVREVVT